jgi:hypothetical protein
LPEDRATLRRHTDRGDSDDFFAAHARGASPRSVFGPRLCDLVGTSTRSHRAMPLITPTTAFSSCATVLRWPSDGSRRILMTRTSTTSFAPFTHPKQRHRRHAPRPASLLRLGTDPGRTVDQGPPGAARPQVGGRDLGHLRPPDGRRGRPQPRRHRHRARRSASLHRIRTDES